jgi:hypothetical protein
MLQIRAHAQHEAIQQARPIQTTEAFTQRYPKCAGIEVHCPCVHAFELRSTRYIGLAKTRLQHIVIAGAINPARIFNMSGACSRNSRANLVKLDWLAPDVCRIYRLEFANGLHAGRGPHLDELKRVIFVDSVTF